MLPYIMNMCVPLFGVCVMRMPGTLKISLKSSLNVYLSSQNGQKLWIHAGKRSALLHLHTFASCAVIVACYLET